MQPQQLLVLLVPLGIVVILLPLILLVIRVNGDGKTITESVDESEFPKRLQRKLQELGSQPQASGFRRVGDRRNKRRGVAGFAREFLSDDSRTIFEIESSKLFGFNAGNMEMAMTSVLDDGTLLQSTSAEKIPASVASVFRDAEVGRPRLIVNPTGLENVSQLFEAHQLFLKRKAQECGAETLSVTPERIPAINKFTMDILDHYMHRQGMLPKSPFGENDGGEVANPVKQILEAVGASLL